MRSPDSRRCTRRGGPRKPEDHERLRGSPDGLDGLVGDYAAGRRPDFEKMGAGVLSYYDPEFVKGNEATNESDVYSLGIVLLELLASQKDGEVPAVRTGAIAESGPLDRFARMPPLREAGRRTWRERSSSSRRRA